ncbi:methyl-accepting chemotaxis protein [Chitinimonas sp. JJ19]|uniref:methyl-accepting chemotaxis protein n=1 Tax=Chitinimonas sp. JJ19 TaxID=3109352 RepID=UPI0030031D53
MQSLRSKLIIAMAILVSIVALILTIASYIRMRDELMAALQSQSSEAAQAAARSADEWLNAKSSIITALAGTAGQLATAAPPAAPEPAADASTPAAGTAEAAAPAAPPTPAAPPVLPFLQLSEKSGQFDTTYVGYDDKQIVFSKPQNLPEGYDPTGRPWYQQAKSAGKTIITEPYLDAATKKLVISMASPVSGATAGVAAGDVFMDGLVSGVLGVKLAHQGYAFALDAKGVVLIHSEEAKRMKPAIEMAPGLDASKLKTLAEGGQMEQITIDGQEKFVQVRPIPSTGWYLAVAIDKSDALAPLGKLLIFSVMLVVVLLAISMALLTATISKMLAGLMRVRDAMRAIATGGGDLTRRIPVSGNDEIAQTAQAFNQFQEQLRQMFVELQGEASHLTDGVNNIATLTRRMAEDSRQLADHGAANAATIEELTVSISHIADYAGDANTLVDATGKLSAEGSNSIAQVSGEIDNSASAVRELSSLFTEVNRRADDIGGIVQVIKEIADQTNLLALNAAIEAARAGEQGRGFAVVADEVRKLAERTGQATQEISTMIGSMRDATQGATGNMQRTLSSVEAGAGLIRETASNIAQIQQRMSEVVSNMREIAHSTSEQRQAATLMAQNAERVTAQIQQSDEALQAMTGTLGELDQLASGIRTMFAKFKL